MSVLLFLILLAAGIFLLFLAKIFHGTPYIVLTVMGVVLTVLMILILLYTLYQNIFAS